MVTTVDIKDENGTTRTVNTLPALGQATKAGSLPVALASDQDALAVTGPLTNAQLVTAALATAANQATMISDLAALVTGVILAAGENHIGQVGGHIAIVTASGFTRPANTTAYAVGDLIANNATAGSVTPITLAVARANDKTGMVRRLRLKTTDTGFAGQTVRAHLYQDSPTVTNGDNGAWLSIASGYLGYADIALDRVFSDSIMGLGVPAVGGEFNFAPHSGTENIFALLESRAVATPQSASTWTLTAEAHQN